MDSCSNETSDWFFKQISDSVKCHGSNDFENILFEAEKTGKSFDVDIDQTGRNGEFEPEQLFAIWENKDIEQLIDHLKRCIK